MDNIVKEHIKKFGKEPLIIGINWEDPLIEKLGIEDAIKNNTPYNEYEMLSDEEKKSFDAGRLLF